VEAFSTGPALMLLKVTPYLLTGLLIRWTMRAIHRSPEFAGFARPAATSGAAKLETPGSVTQPGTAAPAGLTQRTGAAAPESGVCDVYFGQLYFDHA
jgi:hypothetical protein